MKTSERPEFATQRRNELFDSLIEMFLMDGFSHLTLDDVAARLKCSKSTLYTLAGSKDGLVKEVTKHFFRKATEDVEAELAKATGSLERITAYLNAVGRALSEASEQFMTDMSNFAPARGVYEMNTQFAAARVQDLIREGVAKGDLRKVNAAFAADMTSATMVRIQLGEVRARTGLADAKAYQELAAILTAGISA
ncbi:TetR/AcrR family transcriptional regulator [Neomicrococcus lactis]|uniref:AcrR family transcriptional regulator n=1 Tax=Neomicrococcus lactis TaxID=732241 RepID=A0A7W8YC86_9MICC|nr:TetR/AcrR family transcriptional regulator [Neomicrococcus lactis]MBB5598905.1 AcrR family transcriptional regulator [Neomicrococcus lactis]